MKDKMYNFPIYDLHMHRSQSQTAEQMVEKARAAGFRSFGILENAGAWGVRTNEDLKRFIDEVKDYPCYMGLQPVRIGWSKDLDKDLLDQLDYFVMDPQFDFKGNKYGDDMQVWDHNCYVDDAEFFMEQNVQHYLDIIDNPEPLNVFGWPLFLPMCLQRDYYRLWTTERQERIIEAARKRAIAFEINDLAHTPHPEFILRAKSAGVKFTFGSDTRDHRSFRLDYCKRVAQLCGLTEEDFYIPVRKMRK